MGDPTSRLAILRSMMLEQSLDAYVIPHNDAHFSEYLAQRDERLAFISGFTGSAGTAVVLQDKAYLWTDGRYWAQAGKEVNLLSDSPEPVSDVKHSNGDTHVNTDAKRKWKLLKQGVQGVPSVQELLEAQASGPGKVVGIDPWLFSSSQVADWRKAGLVVKYARADNVANDCAAPQDESNLLDKIAGEQLPSRPKAPITVHPGNLAGESSKSKVTKLRKQMKSENASGVLICALDEIAYMLNLRGEDIPYNPVFFGWLLVFRDEAALYCDVENIRKISDDENVTGEVAGVQLKPYGNILKDMEALRTSPAGKIWLDPDVCCAALRDACGSNNCVEKPLPIASWKSIKNEPELGGMKNAHIRDGAAKTKFLMWCKRLAETGELESHTEVTFANKLYALREQIGGNLLVGPSFPTISSTGSNGAIIHYNPCSNLDHQVKMKYNTLYLCDSGCQYRDGTTDVTRTLWLASRSNPAPSGFLSQVTTHYTQVLKGHIQLAIAVFPKSTPGPALDASARLPLWRSGLNFNHGTGHGVGAYLNVHEGPVGISWLREVSSKTSRGRQCLQHGIQERMVLSNEPGFYLTGESGYGIRIENLVHVVKAETKSTTSFFEADTSNGGVGYVRDQEYLAFENLTYIPLEKDLIDTSLLSPEEIGWVNAYHNKCFAKLESFFSLDADVDKDLIAVGLDSGTLLRTLREWCEPLECKEYYMTRDGKLRHTMEAKSDQGAMKGNSTPSSPKRRRVEE